MIYLCEECGNRLKHSACDICDFVNKATRCGSCGSSI